MITKCKQSSWETNKMTFSVYCIISQFYHHKCKRHHVSLHKPIIPINLVTMICSQMMIQQPIYCKVLSQKVTSSNHIQNFFLLFPIHYLVKFISIVLNHVIFNYTTLLVIILNSIYKQTKPHQM